MLYWTPSSVEVMKTSVVVLGFSLQVRFFGGVMVALRCILVAFGATFDQFEVILGAWGSILEAMAFMFGARGTIVEGGAFLGVLHVEVRASSGCIRCCRGYLGVVATHFSCLGWGVFKYIVEQKTVVILTENARKLN